jgi:hypothetical protein
MVSIPHRLKCFMTLRWKARRSSFIPNLVSRPLIRWAYPFTSLIPALLYMVGVGTAANCVGSKAVQWRLGFPPVQATHSPDGGFCWKTPPIIGVTMLQGVPTLAVPPGVNTGCETSGGVPPTFPPRVPPPAVEGLALGPGDINAKIPLITNNNQPKVDAWVGFFFKQVANSSVATFPYLRASGNS